jgi:pSer/pThr/pTyr-binding forkhead associated (FHA) protein
MFERVILKAMNGEGKGREFILENEMDYVLGRALDCSCVVEDPYRLVSRRHCRIDVRAPLVHIQDLGSRNGTQINGKNIGRTTNGKWFEEFMHEEYEEYPLNDGDILQIAGYEFQVKLEPSFPCAAAIPCAEEELCVCDCSSCF